jgi:DegV family protein with EDD domain
VRFGAQIYRDGLDIKNDEFYSRLTSSPIHPATSQPSPKDFEDIYKECCDHAEGILSIHVSSRFSGTYNSAVLAQKTLKKCRPIEIIDSTLFSAGLGMVVIAAAKLAQAGAGISEIVSETNRAIRQIRMFGMFETVKYLSRSGRVNKAITTVSELLHVMPLLTLREGDIMRTGLVRTISQGIDRIYNFVNANSPITELTVIHSAVADRAHKLKQRLSNFIAPEEISIAEVGTSLGVHGGPGILGVAIRRNEGATAYSDSL